MHTIPCTPAPPFWQLSTWMVIIPAIISTWMVTQTHYWHEYTCHSLFGPLACAHGTATQPHHLMNAQACGSTEGACMHMCPHVQACQCSLCVMFAIVY